MLDFKPPEPGTATIQLLRTLMPLVNRWYLKGLTLDVDAESIARLKTIQGHSAVLAPNHPAHEDPAVLFLLSKRTVAAVLLHGRPRGLRQGQVRGCQMQTAAAGRCVLSGARNRGQGRIPDDSEAPVRGGLAHRHLWRRGNFPPERHRNAFREGHRSDMLLGTGRHGRRRKSGSPSM